jgi:hypothetical protein
MNSLRDAFFTARIHRYEIQKEAIGEPWVHFVFPHFTYPLHLYCLKVDYILVWQSFFSKTLFVVGFLLQRGVIVYRDAVDTCCRRYPPLFLLHNMPKLVGQMALLFGGDVYLVALCVRQRLELGGFAGVVVDAYVVKGEAGEVLKALLGHIGDAGEVGEFALRCLALG